MFLSFSYSVEEEGQVDYSFVPCPLRKSGGPEARGRQDINLIFSPSSFILTMYNFGILTIYKFKVIV